MTQHRASLRIAEQPELASALNRLGALAGTELGVDMRNVSLHCAATTTDALGDLLNGQLCWEERENPCLGRREAHRALGGDGSSQRDCHNTASVARPDLFSPRPEWLILLR
jgi:hypothetical protein